MAKWPKIKLGDVCDIERGGSPRPIDKFITENENGVNWIKIGDATESMYITKTAQKIIPEGVNKSRFVKAGDFLLSNSMSFGRPYILKIDGCIHDGWLVLRDKNACFDKHFLYYNLSSPVTYKKFKSMAVGGVVNNLNTEMVKNLYIAFPPLEEQRRIASLLDKVTDLIAKRRAQLEKLDLLVKSRFVEMFGDFNINSKNWPVFSFNEIAIIDSRMTTDYDKYGDYPHIGIDSIEKDTGVLKGYRTIAEDKVISGKYIFTPEHIIYSKIRPNLNKVALPDFDGLCSADAYPILPISEKCNRIFLAYNMRSQFFLNYILQFCNRTNLPKVNRKEVMGFKTPLPPIKLQDSFADFVAITNKTKFTIQQSLERLETLKKSLMQKYFEQ